MVRKEEINKRLITARNKKYIIIVIIVKFNTTETTSPNKFINLFLFIDVYSFKIFNLLCSASPSAFQIPLYKLQAKRIEVDRKRELNSLSVIEEDTGKHPSHRRCDSYREATLSIAIVFAYETSNRQTRIQILTRSSRTVRVRQSEVCRK